MADGGEQPLTCRSESVWPSRSPRKTPRGPTDAGGPPGTALDERALARGLYVVVRMFSRLGGCQLCTYPHYSHMTGAFQCGRTWSSQGLARAASHVEVFRMGGVRASILGRSRALPHDRRAAARHTLNCEMPR